MRGARGRSLQAAGRVGAGRRALGVRACWESGRRRGRRAGRSWAGVGRGTLGVRAWAARRGRAARGARPGRACAHGGHAGWVSWASLGFGEPGSVLTQFFFYPILTQYCS